MSNDAIVRGWGLGSKLITSYRDLKVWQAAMNLADVVYRQTENLPQRETFSVLASADEVGKMLRGLQKSLKARL